MPIIETKNELNYKLLINTRKYLILTIVLVWGSVGLIFFAIKPQVENTMAVNRKLSTEKEQYSRVTRKLNELRQIQISDQFKQKGKVDEVLPSRKPVLELLFNLNQAMQQTQVNISELRLFPGEIESEETAEVEIKPVNTTQKNTQKSTKPASNPRRFSSLKIELTVRGDSDQVDGFLELIERIIPFTSIIELSINERSRGRGESSSIQTEAVMILNSYYYTEIISSTIDSQLPEVGEKELKAFNTIQQFMPSKFEKPTEIQESQVEDLFNIEGFDFGRYL